MNHSQTARTPARTVRADAFVAQMHRTERAAVARAIEHQEMAELERAGIARRIKQARNEAGLSQPEMAEALGVIPRTYQNYESLKDPRTPWGLMNQIATVTGKTTEWLIHGERATPDVLGANGGSQLDRLEEMVTENRDMLAENNVLLERLVGAIERLEGTAVPMPEGELGRILRGEMPTAPSPEPSQRRAAAGSRRRTA